MWVVYSPVTLTEPVKFAFLPTVEYIQYTCVITQWPLHHETPVPVLQSM